MRAFRWLIRGALLAMSLLSHSPAPLASSARIDKGQALLEALRNGDEASAEALLHGGVEHVPEMFHIVPGVAVAERFRDWQAEVGPLSRSLSLLPLYPASGRHTGDTGKAGSTRVLRLSEEQEVANRIVGNGCAP